MPIGFQIYPDSGLLFIRGYGIIAQAERINTMLAWLRDPGYRQCTDAMFDVTAAETTPRLAELREIISILREYAPADGPRKLAIVTARPITYVVAQVFQNLIQPKDLPLQVKVFMDRELAWAWLRSDQPMPEAG
jgi:hypothetical protein